LLHLLQRPPVKVTTSEMMLLNISVCPLLVRYRMHLPILVPLF